ncbi:MAG: hypothetical protein ACR2KW_06285 [Rubrobacter sp.]
MPGASSDDPEVGLLARYGVVIVVVAWGLAVLCIFVIALRIASR